MSQIDASSTTLSQIWQSLQADSTSSTSATTTISSESQAVLNALLSVGLTSGTGSVSKATLPSLAEPKSLSDVEDTESTSSTSSTSSSSSTSSTTNTTVASGAQATSSMIGGMSVENLLAMLNITERQTAINAGMDTLEARAEETKAANDEKIETLIDNLEKEKEAGVLDKIGKALQIIGLVVSAVATVAVGVAACMTGNPLAIAGAVIMGVMLVDSVLSMATDGKYSIAAGVAALGEKCGMSEEAAQWLGLGVTLGITITGAVLSCGGAIAGSAASGATSTLQTAVNITAKASTVASGAVTVAQGAVSVESALLEYEKADNAALMKELQAILERISLANELDLSFLETLLEQNNDLLETVSDIVDGINQTNTAILTSSPAMV